ncbi:fibronectin type III domain-containing protein [Streptomyces coeruleoprunus]|uniref:Fibronectin type III domain-containing protein n=1 Tax=Streptomyces coeruleoprunus TaxID=285563 RepID=A0ABV9XI40_9ACTN
MRHRNRRTRFVTTASALALLSAAALASASVSAAEGEDTLTADPLATWQTDGVVWSLAYAHGVIYAGGSFDKVRPPGAKEGEKEVARKNFAAFDAVTGKLLPCTHTFSGAGDTVRALEASPDGKVLYIGGHFSEVDGQGAASAVALDTAGCTLRKDFRPTVSSYVRAIETAGNTVYLGGDFSTVEGQIRKRIAALSPDGKVLPFTADLDRPVRAITAATDHGKVIVGGDFDEVNGEEVHALVALHPSTGATVSTYHRWLPTYSSVKSLARDKTNFYLGAEGRGTGVFDGRIAGRLADDELVWKDDCLGATQAVVPYKGVLYSGSHAHNCGRTPGGFGEHKRQQHFLANSIADETLLHWFPDTNGGLDESLGPRTMVMAGDILWAGGEFTTVNDQPQQSLTRFAAGPDTGAPEAPPRVAAEPGTGRVTLTWQAAWDRDDATLTYLIYRDGVLVASPTQRSTWWDRPDMSYLDTVAPGSRHVYTIAVSDGENVSPRSAPLSVSAVAAAGPSGE